MQFIFHPKAELPSLKLLRDFLPHLGDSTLGNLTIRDHALEGLVIQDDSASASVTPSPALFQQAKPNPFEYVLSDEYRLELEGVQDRLVTFNAGDLSEKVLQVLASEASKDDDTSAAQGPGAGPD